MSQLVFVACGRSLQMLRLMVSVFAILSLATGGRAQEREPKGDAKGIAADVRLQKKTSASLILKPIGFLLEKLSQEAGITLTAERSILDQRITISVQNTPVSTVLLRLTGLLSHSPTDPRGYVWNVSKDFKGKPAYYLTRSSRSRREEAEALDFPRQKSAQWIRDMRNMLTLSANKRDDYKTDLPKGYVDDQDGGSIKTYLGVIKGLNDAELDQVAQGNTLPIRTTGLEEKIAEFNKRWKASVQNEKAFRLAHNLPDEYPNGVPEMPSLPPSLSLRPASDQEMTPVSPMLYTVQLNGVQLNRSGSSAILFDPLKMRDREVAKHADSDKTLIVNLVPPLSAAKATPEQQNNFLYLADTLAKTANIGIYVESFQHPIGVEQFKPISYSLRGTIRSLLDSWCVQIGYVWEEVNGEYYLWSKTWAFDRQADVSDSLLASWQKRRKDGKLSQEDALLLAKSVSWPQFAINFKPDFPEVGGWPKRRYLFVRGEQTVPSSSP